MGKNEERKHYGAELFDDRIQIPVSGRMKEFGKGYDRFSLVLTTLGVFVVTGVLLYSMQKGLPMLVGVTGICVLWGSLIMEIRNCFRMSSIYKNADMLSPGRVLKDISAAGAFTRLLDLLLWTSGIILCAGYFMVQGFSKPVGFSVMGAFLLFVLLEVVSYRRLTRTDLTPEGYEDCRTVPVEKGEEIVDYFTGLRRVGPGAGSRSILGIGSLYSPENAVLVTNKKLWFITVPMEGAGKIISGIDISLFYWTYAPAAVENMLMEMLASMTLTEVVGTSGKYFTLAFKDMTNFQAVQENLSLIFSTRDKKSYYYCFKTPGDFEKAKAAFERLV